MKGGKFRPEARSVIPWFERYFVKEGHSVCRGRWVAIHANGKVCYAQWQDVGPFHVDDYEYVFLGKDPRPNRNANAGIDVSPAVRDFLGLKGVDKVDWRFVDDGQVPDGPWSRWQVTPQQDAWKMLEERKKPNPVRDSALAVNGGVC